MIWINSNGGDVLAAIESINLIKSSPIPVVTIINGCAESAALLIAMAGHRRLIFESSWGMAHHFSTSMEGNYHELIDSVKHNNLLHHLMMELFKKHSKLSEKEIDAKLLGRKHTWLDANELKKMGLVDEIIKLNPFRIHGTIIVIDHRFHARCRKLADHLRHAHAASPHFSALSL